MKLGKLLAGVRLREPLSYNHEDLEITGLEYDSRRIEGGNLFFAFEGSHADGRRFAQDALARGAAAVVSDSPRPAGFLGPWIEVEHARRAMSAASRAFYNHPDKRVHFTGVTGTNGKTTTSYLIEAILRSAGKITGVVGTIEYRIAGQTRPAPNTTPESLDLARLASSVAEAGGTHLISEVSSHALQLGRVDGFYFHTAVLTNVSRDHLDFHQTMESYVAAKRMLFLPKNGPAPKWVVLNADDAASAGMAPPDPSNVIWYSAAHDAALRAENIRNTFEGLHFDLIWKDERQAISSPLVGNFNVSNILAAVAVGISYALPLDVIARGIASCAAVPGRFERITCGQPFLVVVDYAHTDDALRNVITTARALVAENKGRVITLFGCGGDRDRTKRPMMGMAAGELSDFVVLTSDNPRSEDPLGIMNDAMVGLGKFDTPHLSEPDRAKAIRAALSEARAGDVVLLAGKGHETYQILKNETIRFDDRETARAVLSSLGYRESKQG
ncbi:MAG: UDP-N-acetylmuramoyl-L-alanyl-D-glutamate--2,6-diaminopimelate ligase [Bryobacteraceae bacterium]